jgi:hypothetical protein
MLAENMEISVDHRHSQVALQASLAAIALDQRIRDKNASVSDVEKLVALLRSTIGAPPAGQKNLLDPTAIELWTRALNRSHLEQTLSNTDSGSSALSSLPEVTQVVEELMAKLEQASALTDPRELTELRNFCVALSQSAQLDLPSVFANTGFPELV